MSATADDRQGDVWRVLFRVAEASATTRDLPAFYRAMHAIVGELMDAKNLFIAIYDEERQRINFPYYVDEYDETPDPSAWFTFDDALGRGCAAYVLRTGEPQLINDDDMTRLVAAGELEAVGVVSGEGDWLGVPLKAGGRTIGVLTVQSYTKDVDYTERDRDQLAYVGQHIGAALERVRAVEETHQRTLELETVNDVTRALASQLDFDALVTLVGERMRETFQADIVYVALLDPLTDRVDFPYQVELGESIAGNSIPRGEGLTGRIMETREPLLLNSLAEIEAIGQMRGTPCKSYLGVPIILAGEATGVISVQSAQAEGRFGPADVELLSTLAANVGVAVNNARLYREAERRVGEMAAVAELGREVLALADLDAVLHRIAERAQLLLDAHTCALQLRVGMTDELVTTVVVGDESQGMEGFRFTFGTGLIGDVAQRGVAELVNDA